MKLMINTSETAWIYGITAGPLGEINDPPIEYEKLCA